MPERSIDSPDLVIRELFRHYESIRDHRRTETGKDVFSHKGFDFAVSELDLKDLNLLTPRQKEAFYFNIVLDMKQREVAELLGISTVSVGQYVQAASERLAAHYFPEKIDPMVRKCKWCRKRFESEDEKIGHCSPECKVKDGERSKYSRKKRPLDENGHFIGWKVGTGAYRKGCRCEACREVSRERRRERLTRDRQM